MIHGVHSHLEVTSANVSLEIQREAVNAIVTAKNSLPKDSVLRVLKSIRSHTGWAKSLEPMFADNSRKRKVISLNLFAIL